MYILYLNNKIYILYSCYGNLYWAVRNLDPGVRSGWRREGFCNPERIARVLLPSNVDEEWPTVENVNATMNVDWANPTVPR